MPAILCLPYLVPVYCATPSDTIATPTLAALPHHVISLSAACMCVRDIIARRLPVYSPATTHAVHSPAFPAPQDVVGLGGQDGV